MIIATLAQLVEQCFRKAEVPSSNLGGGSNHGIIPVAYLQFGEFFGIVNP